jgi:CRP-like cAMP-binding protein
MNEQYAEMMRTFPLFKGFTPQGAQTLLGYGEVKEYSQGDVLLKEGDSPTFVLVVLTGRMQIYILYSLSCVPIITGAVRFPPTS